MSCIDVESTFSYSPLKLAKATPYGGEAHLTETVQGVLASRSLCFLGGIPPFNFSWGMSSLSSGVRIGFRRSIFNRGGQRIRFEFRTSTEALRGFDIPSMHTPARVVVRVIDNSEAHSGR